MNTKQKGLVVAGIIAIVVIGFAAYELFFSYSNSKDHFQLKLDTQGASSWVTYFSNSINMSRGSQTELSLQLFNFDSTRDSVTLTISGNAAYMSSFYEEVNGTMQNLAQVTLNGGVNAAKIVIKVPNDTPSGAYQVAVTGTNSAGITSQAVYAFSVS